MTELTPIRRGRCAGAGNWQTQYQALQMTAREAAALASTIRPKVAVPTHYGCIVGEMADGDAFAAGLDDGIQCVKLIG